MAAGNIRLGLALIEDDVDGDGTDVYWIDVATSHQSWTVSKLHSDLVSLRKHLAKHFPTLQIPPLSTTAMPTVTGGGTGSRRGSGSGRSGSGSGSGSGGSGNVGGGANAGVGGGSGHAASNTKHKIPGAMIRAFLAYIVAHSMILHSRAVNEFFEGKESDRAAGWSSRPCLRHEFFAQVDYARQQVLTQPEHQVVVKQRNRHICPIEVREPKSMIIWEFRTQKFDIAFSIVRPAQNGPRDTALSVETTVLPYSRQEAQRETILGYVAVSEPGLYHLVWDNSYASFHSKRLTFKYCDVPQALWNASAKAAVTVQQSASSRVAAKAAAVASAGQSTKGATRKKRKIAKRMSRGRIGANADKETTGDPQLDAFISDMEAFILDKIAQDRQLNYQGLKMHLLETYSPEFFNGHKGLVQQTMRDSMLAQQQVAEENKKKQRKQQSSKQQSQSRGGQANDEAKAKGFTNRSGPENVLSNDDEEELDEEELAAQELKREEEAISEALAAEISTRAAFKTHVASNSRFPVYWYMAAAADERRRKSTVDFVVSTTFRVVDFAVRPWILSAEVSKLRGAASPEAENPENLRDVPTSRSEHSKEGADVPPRGSSDSVTGSDSTVDRETAAPASQSEMANASTSAMPSSRSSHADSRMESTRCNGLLAQAQRAQWQACIDMWRAATQGALQLARTDPDASNDGPACPLFQCDLLPGLRTQSPRPEQDVGPTLFRVTERWKSYQQWQQFYSKSEAAAEAIAAVLEIATPLYTGCGPHEAWKYYTTGYRVDDAPAREAEQRIKDISRETRRLARDLDRANAAVEELSQEKEEVLRAEAEQLKVLSDVDAVYTEIATLRDEVRSGKAATRDALSEMLELHFQCQQLEQQNRILAERLVKTQGIRKAKDAAIRDDELKEEQRLREVLQRERAKEKRRVAEPADSAAAASAWASVSANRSVSSPPL
eukprot:INCI17445.1.p1 GENE.INCI17445.1~~INCI17445.1.p1  ORF type:complete len:969 (-),score=212.34 INCI17445.1:2145-4991(-)